MRNLTFTLFIIILCCLTSFRTAAQPYAAGEGGASVPSAAAMSYGKYADIPVNQYTGTGNVAVPLASVSDGPLSLSVGIQYHTGGLPVGAPAGAVGLGWNLNYGGMISRTIRGLADDLPNGYFHEGANLNTGTGHLIQASSGQRDSEPDTYTYSVGSYSGKFTFNESGNVILIPKSDVKILPVYPNDEFTAFKIITPDGTIYYFGESPDGTREAVDYSKVNADPVAAGSRTGWHLIRVESFDQKHAIDLYYQDIGYVFESLSYCPDVVKYRKSNGNVITIGNCGGELYQENKIRSVLPLKIESTHQTLDFSHSLRDDYDDFDGTYKARKVDGLTLSDGTHCVGYEFTQSYFKSSHLSSAEKRLKLDNVQKVACDNGPLSEPAWTFNYAGTIFQIGEHFFPAHDDKNIDHWGYYNLDNSIGANTSNDLTPPSRWYLGNAYIEHGDANREANESAMLNGMLDEVIYPTGGSLKIDYEANSHYQTDATEPAIDLMSCNTTNCGGTKTVTSSPLYFTQDMVDNGGWELCLIAFDDGGPNNGYDPNNNLAKVEVYNSSNTKIQTRSFNSTTDACQSGGFPYLGIGPAIQAGQSYTFKLTSLNCNATFSIERPASGTNEIVGGLRIKKTTVYDGVSPANNIVTNYDYTTTGSTNSSGKLFRKPNYAYQLNPHTVLFTSYSASPTSSFAGSHIGYSRVITSQPGNGETQMFFDIEDDQANVHLQFPVPPAKYKAEAGTMTSSFVKSEQNTVLASSSVNRYGSDNYEIIGAASGQGVMYTGRNVQHYDGSGSSTNGVYSYTTYQLRTSIYRPGSVTTVKDGVSSTTSYDYHPNNLLPDDVETTNSDGDTYRTETTYASDYFSYFLRLAFLDRNMRHLPYLTKKFYNNDHVDGSKTIYQFFNANGDNPSIYPSTGAHPRLYENSRYTRTFNAAGTLQSGAYETQMTYTDYTNDGLIASYEEPNWNPVTINYLNKLPITKVFSGHVTQYIYEPNSSVLQSVVNVDGTRTDYTYDDLMRLETVTDDCKNIVTTHGYHFSTGPGDKNYTTVSTNYPTPSGRSQVDVMETKTFKDGLGRTLQTIAKGLGPNTNQDVIKAVSYDNLGRAFKAYEPKAFTNNNGTYKTPGSSWDYTETTYEDSPLGRTLTVTPPDWHPSTFSYGKNSSSDDVKIDGSGTAYTTGKLIKQTVQDANGNKLITFTDKLGRKVLSRRTNGTDQVSKRLDTYYLYDGKGRVTKVIPPGASAGSSELVYTYLYDGEDRVVEKKIPGKEKIEYRYNNRDLLAAERDGHLRNEGDWYVHSYDVYGREKESGFYNTTPPSTIVDLTPTDALLKTFYGTGHEKDKVKTVETRILGTTDWLTTTNTYSTCGLLTQQTGNNHLRLTTSNPETTTYTYDGADNLVGSTYTHKVANATHTIASKHYYDHAGRSDKNYFKVDNGTDRQLNEFVYDEKGQVVTKYQGATGLSGTRAFLQKVDYGYLANGMLEGINLNGLTGNQVSLPGSGAVASNPNPGTPSTGSYDNKDLFYLQLYRDDPANVSGPGPAPARYNGDISFVASQVRGRRQQLFGVKYDTYDRMTEAKFYERISSGSTGYRVDAYSENLAYDDRGNIEQLRRKGVYKSGVRYYQTVLDSLNYKFEQSDGADNNRLRKISDSGSSNRGYKVGSGGEFAYDDNGNTTYDPSREISIVYNHLDLPTEISWADGRKLRMTYDAAGTLLTRETIPAGTSTPSATRHFVGGIEYSGAATSPTLEVVHHSEGRIRFSGTSQEWQYSLTDHLGNTRLLYADLNNDGIPAVPSEIIQEEHYYPFGMKMTGPWMGAAAGAKTAYQYNGVEHVDDFDLNVNMAFYRTLDPTTGRWWSVDPKAEKYTGMSPFNSMGNSPMTFADPNGDEPITIALGIAAAMGAFNGYQIGKARGVDGVGLVGYAIGGAAIGFASAGVGSAITTGVGGAVAGQFGGLVGSAIGGAAGGAIAGGGFAGLAGQDPMRGLWKGAVSGFIGGGLGAYVGGGAGSFIGSFASSSTNSAFHGANFSSSMRSGLIAGVTSLGVHHLTSYLNYQQIPQKSWMSYRQFRTMSTASQRSFARGREFGGWLLEDGGVKMWKPGTRAGITPTPVPDNVLMSFHTHPNAGPKWNPGFSPADINYNIANNVSEYVISRQSIYAHSPPGRRTYNLGINSRFNPYKYSPLWWQN